jgi:hypothetical protein
VTLALGPIAPGEVGKVSVDLVIGCVEFSRPPNGRDELWPGDFAMRGTS